MNISQILRSFFTALLFAASTGFAEDNTLDQQIIPGLRNSATYQANTRIEKVILEAWQTQYQQFMDAGDIPRAVGLLNAPISGQTEHRGRHLLSFSAFSGFKKLATWALTKGADINRGDKDNATMLRMAISNQLPYMVEFALKNGANPNWLQGANKDNAFGNMMRFGWPLHGFELAWEHGARLRDKEQRDKLMAYLQKEHTDESWQEQARLKYFLEKLKSPVALVPESKPVLTTTPGQPVETYMIGVMDAALKDAMINEKLSSFDAINFNVHGIPLVHYLTFNGMTETLGHILSSLPRSAAIYQAKRRDRTGNDLITAAIKSLNAKALRIALTTSSNNINAKTPSLPVYYSKGSTPLHIAVQWEAPDEIFTLLFEYGAKGSLETTNDYGLTPEQVLEQWYPDSQHYDRIKKALAQ
ncbi:hypothetical protein [Parendozoicomonas sp. Alg238-R29]|uniref:hypothetical protein n=1 Tax=Parendozoicomonas sp. Alg238-R29 TaxID=2993446 RepID=UPI00248E611E|nr:hypothetical protein [Parendozoicomonas sp. Alg238-R29]